MTAWNTVFVVLVTPLAIAGVQALSRELGELLPEGRFKRVMTRHRGYKAPDRYSLRSGLDSRGTEQPLNQRTAGRERPRAPNALRDTR